MAAATRPVSGQAIESTWGGQVHDAAVTRRGVAVTAATYATNTVGTLDLNAVVEGDATLADLAANQLIVPAAGLWQVNIEASASGINTGTGAYALWAYVNGAALFGVNGPGIGGNQVKLAGSALRQLAAGDRLELRTANVGGAAAGTQSLTLVRFALALAGQALGAS